MPIDDPTALDATALAAVSATGVPIGLPSLAPPRAGRTRPGACGRGLHPAA
jgi:hypothetical protein